MSRIRTLTLSRQNNREWRPTSECAYTLEGGKEEYHIISLCAQEFHAVTGFNLKPGQKTRIEIIIKEVDDG